MQYKDVGAIERMTPDDYLSAIRIGGRRWEGREIEYLRR